MSVEGGQAVFLCRCPSHNILEVNWTINGMLYNESRHSVTTRLKNGIGRLTFENISGTGPYILQCQVTFSDLTTGHSKDATLLVQG